MRYSNYVLIWLLSVFSSFTTKSFQVDGYLNDVSPHEEWVLYRVPDDWGADDLHLGYLKALNIRTKEVLEIASIFIEQPSTFFLNDSIVAIPLEGQVELYNLKKKKFEKKVLISYPQEYQLLQFSLNEDRSKAAVLLVDSDSSIKGPGPDSNRARVVLKVIDLKTHQEHVLEQYDYGSEGCEGGTEDMLWHGDQLIYSVQSQLYYYQLDNPRRRCLAKRIGAYAIDGDQLIFGTAIEDEYYHFKSFSFADLSIKDVEFEGDSLVAWQPYNLHFYTTHIENDRRAALSKSYLHAYYVRTEKGKFKKQDELILYKSKQLIIDQCTKSIKLEDGTYDNKTVLEIHHQGE